MHLNRKSHPGFAGPSTAKLLTPAVLTASLLSCAALVWPVAPTQAQGTPALVFTNDGFTDTSYTGTLGWEFTANSQVNLMAFGFFNNNKPLAKNYTVALYDVSGKLLSSGSVGTSSTKNGAFNYTALAAPVTLQSGRSYIIAALLSQGDTYYFFPGGVTMDPSLSYVQNRYDDAQTAALTFPTSSDDATSGKGYFGPSFMIAAAPEPSQYAVLGLGLLGVGGLGLRARFRSQR